MRYITIETGTRYGNLTIIKEVEPITDSKGKRHRQFLCRCDCGNEKVLKLSHLRRGTTKSCGCLVGKANITHNGTKTRLYRRWFSMKKRCSNPKDHRYHLYGGRGIKVCDEWQNYESFRDWALSNGYSDELTIDRIDVNGNYEPSNCRWATPQQQSDNKRSNILITIDGITLDLQQWCDKIGINRSTVNTRVRMCGWDYVTALTTPVRHHKEYERKS